MTEFSLKELVNIKNGRDHQALTEGPIPVLGSGGVMRYVDQYLYDRESILLPRKGSLSNIQFASQPFWTVDTLYYTEVDKTKCEPYYLYNYLKLLDLSGLNSGTGVPSMTFGAYYSIKVKLPSLSTQKQIAKVLSDLDAKIELNNQINTELEAMAKLVYDYWFVQFDFPYDFAQGKPDPNGKPYKSSGGKMVYNKVLKREIPEGWNTDLLGNKLVTSLGGTPSTKRKEFWDNGEYNWLNSGEIANFPVIDSELKITKEAIQQSATDLLPKGSVVMSITRHIRPSILGIEACANQSVIGILENDIYKSGFIFPFIKNEVPRFMALRTGAQQPHINKGIVDSTLFLEPNPAVLTKYYKVTNSIYDKIVVNAKENQELASLRDWLLPMLMNGQVTVGEGYDIIEEKLGMVAEGDFKYGEG